MNWRRIPKERSVQPLDGSYSSWKELLAEEGFHQCVYCAIRESSFGGIRNFHVEHYKPKHLFRDLENDFQNLFYACCICNVFKGGDWPGDPDPAFRSPCFPNPSKINYGDLFRIEPTGILGPAAVENSTGRYLIEKLYLNRPQLIIERRLEFVFLELERWQQFFEDAWLRLRVIQGRDQDVRELLASLSGCLLLCTKYLLKLQDLRPYSSTDVKRQ